MADNNALAQGLQGYSFMLTPQANTQLRNITQQQALGQALQTQGLDPLQTSGRQVGGVGYNISPWEGASKLAQAIVGSAEKASANNQFNDLFNPQPAVGSTSQGPFNPAFQQTLQAVQQKYNLTPYEAMTVLQDPSALGRVISANAPTPEMKNATMAYGAGGAPGAVKNIMDLQQFPGQKSYQEGVGSAAAQQAPAGTMPAGPGGIPNPPPRPSPSFPPPVSGYTIGNDGIHLPALPPDAAGSMQGMPPVAQQTLQNAVAPVGGSPSSSPALPPINTAGMTNAQAAAAIEAQKAGASAQAEQSGKNVAEANKGVASIDSRIDNAKAIIQEMKTLAPQVPYGPHGMAEAQVDLSNTPLIGSGKAAGAHNRFETLNQNLFTQELPAIVQSSGGRIDIPLVKAIQAASSVDIDAHPYAKAQALDELSSLLDKVQQNAKNYQGALTGQPPAQAAPKTTNWTFQNGKLVPAQ